MQTSTCIESDSLTDKRNMRGIQVKQRLLSVSNKRNFKEWRPHLFSTYSRVTCIHLSQSITNTSKASAQKDLLVCLNHLRTASFPSLSPFKLLAAAERFNVFCRYLWAL